MNIFDLFFSVYFYTYVVCPLTFIGCATGLANEV